MLLHFHSWRQMRRASHEALSKVVVQRYHPIQTKEATILVSALLESPENRDQHIRRTTASTIMSIVYDHPTLISGQDKGVQEIDRNGVSKTRAALRTSLFEFFPWMTYVPKRLMVSTISTLHLPKELTGLQSGRGKA